MSFKRNILLSLTMIIGLCSQANASKLPDDVWNYVKTNLPTSQQRFDSVIIVSEDVMYIPLYPPTDKTVDFINEEYTFPENTSLNKLPEVILLNNGYSFLKVFKDEKGNYTLTKKDDLPIKVRLGLMPQDMLTPVGLKMPESLKLTLGDLLIPAKEDNTLALTDTEKTKNNYSASVKRNEFVPLVELKDKKTFINPKNSKFLEVYDNTSQTPLYELKLSSIPLKIITSETSKVALVLYWGAKNVEIIDLKDERIISSIPLDASATDAVLDKNNNIAYVSSQNAKAIYLINLNSMQLVKVIKLDQKPTKIAFSEEDETVAFFDEHTSKIFNVKKESGEYSVLPMGSINNISKVLTDKDYIYAVSRIQNELYIFDKHEGKLINTIEIDKKPTDAILYNDRIYILCAKEGYLDVFDVKDGKIISREQLSKEGFYSNITLIPNNNNILITGINTKNYLLYNLDTMKLVKEQESYIDVSNIIILDKAQKL